MDRVDQIRSDCFLTLNASTSPCCFPRTADGGEQPSDCPQIGPVIRMMTGVADRSAMDGRLNGRAKSSIVCNRMVLTGHLNDSTPTKMKKPTIALSRRQALQLIVRLTICFRSLRVSILFVLSKPGPWLLGSGPELQAPADRSEVGSGRLRTRPSGCR